MTHFAKFMKHYSTTRESLAKTYHIRQKGDLRSIVDLEGRCDIIERKDMKTVKQRAQNTVTVTNSNSKEVFMQEPG
ncbi:hypothetical protein RvY_13253 [Ramazzottius varieornatus]|uniref:Uncharacterized protein n=1 Tax=Ramazzottius varieornatus TaxID=947166 RepID=A0A1D1VUR9_RAMVA|nr:hypothetical protein RvY_13253 [Ramazzottius varieornatus]